MKDNKLEDSMLEGVIGGFDSFGGVEVEVSDRYDIPGGGDVMRFDELQRRDEEQLREQGQIKKRV